MELRISFHINTLPSSAILYKFGHFVFQDIPYWKRWGRAWLISRWYTFNFFLDILCVIKTNHGRIFYNFLVWRRVSNLGRSIWNNIHIIAGHLFLLFLHLNELLTALNTFAILMLMMSNILNVLSLPLAYWVALYDQTLALVLVWLLWNMRRGHLIAFSNFRLRLQSYMLAGRFVTVLQSGLSIWAHFIAVKDFLTLPCLFLFLLILYQSSLLY